MMTDDEILARAAEIRLARAKERKRLQSLSAGMSLEALERRRTAQRARYAELAPEAKTTLFAQQRLYQRRPEIKARREQLRQCRIRKRAMATVQAEIEARV